MTLTDLCMELKNWFERGIFVGDFEISNGTIDLSSYSMQDGQYFRIAGSVFNDGVHQYPAYDLTDESFHGAVWAMAVPPSVIALLDEINAWMEDPKIIEAMNRPYQSESFGGYSYTKASGGGSSSSGGGDALSWQNRFAVRLNKWRKIR